MISLSSDEVMLIASTFLDRAEKSAGGAECGTRPKARVCPMIYVV